MGEQYYTDIREIRFSGWIGFTWLGIVTSGMLFNTAAISQVQSIVFCVQ
jgi:putative copper export protein